MGQQSVAAGSSTEAVCVRNYRPEDKAALEEIHRNSGLDYKCPDYDSPLFFIRRVLEVDGKVVAALVLKVCAETQLLLGATGAKDKFLAMKLLQDSVLRAAYEQGLDEIHASIPPIGFDDGLRHMGWTPDRDGWRLWTRCTCEKF